MNGNEKDLFVIESSFQALGAIEALKYFKPAKAILVIKYTHEEKNNSQINELVKLVKWDKVFRFQTRFFISFSEFMMVPFIAFLKIFGFRYNRIFIGEARSSAQLLFLANLKHRESYFLDDGNFTINLQKGLLDGKDLQSFTIQNQSFKEIKKLYYGVFFIKQRIVAMPNWFTCFDIEPLPGQVIYKNTFNFLLENYLKEVKGSSNKVYFIGGNLSECGVLQIEDELLLIERIIRHFKEYGGEIVYCVHRRESESKLERILSLDPQLELRRAIYPLELDLIFNREKPKHIASFYSTALLTTTQIFQIRNVKMFVIPEKMINTVYKEEVLNTYKNYRQYFEAVIDF